MKVLFLDVDGVLNSRESTNFKNNRFPVDDYLCFLVARIQMKTDCAIVISSSWRHDKIAMDILKERFNNVIGRTGYSNLVAYEDSPRGHEVQEWLDQHPEVTKYAILDDDSDFMEHQKPNFFQTTFDKGITEEIAWAVTEHLNGVD